MNFETENMEFKSKVTDEIYKEIIAFANTNGGIIYVGIDDQGQVIGLTDVDKEYTRITNGIRDAIMPDVTMFVRFTIQENTVVKITVSEGSNKPYYLKAKGLKPSGVYVRQGTSSAPASPEQIRQLIKDNDGDSFELMISKNQLLTFEEASQAFHQYGVEFSKEKYNALGMVSMQNNLFTNLAYILSDQCEHTVKIAVFGDDSNTTFKDHKEFSGSIFKQLEGAFNYLKLCNKTASTFKGLERIEHSDYPEEAIREVLLNALVHRDYSFSGSIIINVNDKEMEVISIGGLLSGLSPDDIKNGISQPRNRNLAEVFHRLHLIESYGTGIRRIFHLYEGYSVQPRIDVTSNTFKIVLPNMNTIAKEETKDVVNEFVNELTPQMQQILEFIKEHGEIRELDIQDLLGVKQTRAYIVAKQMRDLGVIRVLGRGKNKIYKLND
ncbi:ATP-dependent DNA helicase [Lachnospiraceae bacterium TWA4]|nr:ATP-dependent DNA helicase [Lachnospiraceae bacterium TWA4]